MLHSCGRGIRKWSVGILYSHLKYFFYFQAWSGFMTGAFWRMQRSSTTLYNDFSLCYLSHFSSCSAFILTQAGAWQERNEDVKSDSAKLGNKDSLLSLSFPPHLNDIFKKKHRNISIPMQIRLFIAFCAKLDQFFSVGESYSWRNSGKECSPLVFSFATLHSFKVPK